MPSPAIILVRPQMGENIGAAARAMLNFGITDLRLVDPRDEWPNAIAKATASGALDYMPAAALYQTLDEALADCHAVYATSARRRDMVKPVLSLNEAQERFSAHQRADSEEQAALVFGPERTGLTNDEVALCHTLLNIPTNPEFSSINLAQSVLLVAYEWSQASRTFTPPADQLPAPAPHKDLNEFLERLNTELEDKAFFRDEGLKPTMQRNIKNMFTRQKLTEQEIRTFHGIVSALIGNKLAEKDKSRSRE